MASDSPNMRINQYFASKKRKAVSPNLKSERIGIDTKKPCEGSPSAKGTLDNYLKSSQDNNHNPQTSHITTQNAVKRNLVLENAKSSEDKNKSHSLLSSQVNGKISERVKETLQAASQVSHEGIKLAAGDLVERCPGKANHVVNSELKQFATNFLSLYCSELKSNVQLPSGREASDIKRYGSPSLFDGEDKTSKKRQCVFKEVQLVNEKSKDAPSGFASKITECVAGSSREVITNSESGLLQLGLRKCSTVPKPFTQLTECCTPGSSMAKTFPYETPKSACGSSSFSPGEAFWSEAIQVADGLFIPTDCCNVTEIHEQKDQCELINSNSVKNKICEQKLKEVECEVKVRTTNFGLSSELVRLKRDSDKGTCVLPVKHFDFLFDDKNSEGSHPHGCATDIPKDIMLKNREIFECGSVTRKDRRTSNMVRTDCEAQTTDEKLVNVQERTSNHKGNIPISPVSGVRNLVRSNQSDEVSTPSSSVPLKDSLDISNWLPSQVCSIYKKRGISKLYPWQVECLQVDGVLQKRNLVYCASTSAGKSFVAEILMLRRVLASGKMALLVLPYVSICAEKAEHLEVLLEPLGKHVRSYYGNQGGGTLPKDTSVAVCTIEKANILINRLLEEGRLSEVGIIVIDELHMVGDQKRGYLLELMLTKLRYAAGEGVSETSSGESSGTSSGKSDPANGLQIVGMSATMPNVGAVAEWLQAALYQTEFRPVPLVEYFKEGNTIYNKKMEIVRKIPKAADLGGKDPDHIVELCNEVVQEGHSVLIFCSSRKGCESTAKHISGLIKNFSVSIHDDSEFADVASAIDALQRSPAGVDPILQETLPFGVAYHHAGLTVEEREIVESCYRRGLVRILTATSTLAAGVNLPARRVIFRQPMIGRDFIDVTRYKQMAGRAGRTGIDTKGESVLIGKREQIKRIMGLLNEGCPLLQSCLSEDKNGMTHAILEVVAGGIVQTAKDIHRYVRCTLLNSTKPFEDVVKSAQDSLRWLCHNKFLEWHDDTKLYSTTPLGRAAFGSSLCPEESLIVLDDLVRAREGFVLASDLHLVYLVTPINVDVEPDWELYYERFMQLSSLEQVQSVGNRVGVEEPFLMRTAHGAPMRYFNRSKDQTKALHGQFQNRVDTRKNSKLSDEQIVRVCKRFYVALILSKLVQEVPVSEVCDAFKVARGMVQALQENAGRFASMVSVFCERLGWHDLEGLVSKFQNRISFGVRAEIVELTTIPFVKGSRARALYKAGLRSPLAIAEASIPEIVKAIYETSSWAVQENSAQRRTYMGVAKKIKNGARKIVLEKAEEARIAAFSAFQSLGLNMPQLSQPLQLTTSRNADKQEEARAFVALDQLEHKPCQSHINENVNANQSALESEGEKLAVESVNCLAVSSDLNLTSQAERALADGKLDSGMVHPNDTVVNVSVQVGKICNEDRTCEKYAKDRSGRENLSSGNKDAVHEEGPLNAVSLPGGLDSFLDLWGSVKEFYFDIHYNKQSQLNSRVPFEIHGIAVCWENSPVYYVNLPKDLLWSEIRKSKNTSTLVANDKSNALTPHPWLQIVKDRWNRICEVLGRRDVQKFTWNLKVQIQVLKHGALSIQRFGCLGLAEASMGLDLIDNSYFLLSPVQIKDSIDLCTVVWILWPDEERSSHPNLEKEVKKRLSTEAAAAANRSGRWKNQMRRVAHNGCCLRVAQTRSLCSVLWKILISEDLVEPLMTIEMPLVKVLADMELCGIGVDVEGCFKARNVLGKKLRFLEKEAYKLAGKAFSLYAAADIANVLYQHLKLPVPEGNLKGKQHPSTDKHSLDLLRDEHPIVPVIKEHRTLAKLMNSTLGSICSLSKLSMSTQKYTLHGHWLQTSTATGRLSMEEPNLQCVEHVVEFKLNKDENGVDTDADQYIVNARDFFVPTQENWLLVTADYSQIELRLMAHFSRDSSLIELLTKPEGDVFNMIAAKWTGRPQDSIVSNEREQTKRLVYGILYGMGANTLAEQLSCSPDEAKEKITKFKSCFPGIGSWLQETILSCRKKGYVETLKGRKRFLSKIKFGNSEEKSKAQRQAVNSICQGSAADIIKIAMIKIHSVIVEGVEASLGTKFHMLKGRCRILLQVHDELVLEADPSLINEAALLLKTSMETAVSLLVPMHVKLKVGRTWGSLETVKSVQCVSESILLAHKELSPSCSKKCLV